MNDAATHPGQQLAEFAAALRAEAIPAAVLERAEDLIVDWLGSALAGKGARPVETIARFAERMGAGRRAQRGADPSPRQQPALRGDGQRRRVARRRTGRRAQRLGVASGDGRLSAGARRRAGARQARRRAARGGRRRLRGRHPRRRVPGPLALQASSTPPAPPARSPPPRRPAACSRLDRRRWRTPSARPARRPRGCGNSCARPPTPSSCTPRTRRRRA